MKYIDTHCHIQFNEYKNDASEVISRALGENVAMITVGANQETSARGVEWAEKIPDGLWAAVGLHPTHLFDGEIGEQVEGETIAYKTGEEKFDHNFYKNLCASKKVVAVGEVGLDYWHKPSGISDKDFRRRQAEAFGEEIALAKELNLPLILHLRPSSWNSDDAYEDCFNILKNAGARGVLHCYAGKLETAKKFLDLGYYLGFTGIITFPPQKVAPILETLAYAPLDKILSETDAPYLSPAPYRGKRNEPAYVKYVVEKIAEIKGMDQENVARELFKNATGLFKIYVKS
jgi:TatD DNase family protein